MNMHDIRPSKAVGLAVLAGLLALGSGAAAAPRTQYDLLCQSGGSAGAGSWTLTTRYSIDLPNAQWCQMGCASVSALTVSDRDVVLNDGPKHRTRFSPAKMTVTESYAEGSRESVMHCKYKKFTGLAPKAEGDAVATFGYRPRQ